MVVCSYVYTWENIVSINFQLVLSMSIIQGVECPRVVFYFLSLTNFYFLSPYIMFLLISLFRIPSSILDFPSGLIFFLLEHIL